MGRGGGREKYESRAGAVGKFKISVKTIKNRILKFSHRQKKFKLQNKLSFVVFGNFLGLPDKLPVIDLTNLRC